jgi:hypothetical protein
LSRECAAGSNQRAIDGKIFEGCGRCGDTLSGAVVLHPVQEYPVHHDMGFRKPINAVRFHLLRGLSLRIPKA